MIGTELKKKTKSQFNSHFKKMEQILLYHFIFPYRLKEKIKYFFVLYGLLFYGKFI